MRILQIQRMSTEDGPGLRTTVFFKGCPLRCQWCHNPESLSSANQKEWISIRCIRCGICISVCPRKALSMDSEGIRLDAAACDLCLACVKACPTEAMSAMGRDMTAPDLVRELVKDKAYFGAEGGVTLSGGEVMSQAPEALEVCKLLKKERVSIALDTSGFAPFSVFEGFLPYVDLILYDLKLIEPDAHRRWCGVDNGMILDNLIKLSDREARLWIRTPVIPGATDSTDNIEGIGTFLNDHSIRMERWELCAFNNLCKDKYQRLGWQWAFRDTPLETKEYMELLNEIARKTQRKPDVVIWTGMTRIKEESK